MKHAQYPLLLPFLALVSGVVFYRHLQFPPPSFFLLVPLFVMAGVALRSPLARRFLMPILIGTAFFLMGWGRAATADVSNQNHHITKQNFSNQAIFYGQVLDEFKSTANYRRLVVELDGVRDSVSFPVMGKVLLNFPKDGPLISQDSKITWKGMLQNFAKPAYDGAFDYGAYLAQQGIFGQFFLRDSNQFKVLEVGAPKAFDWADYRKKTLDVLQTLEMQKDGKAFLAALLLGSKEDLSTNQRNDFSAAGTMHLLAVSGLHVGIIYLIGFHLLGMGRGPAGHFWKVPLLLLIIWLYAGITGLSPSVTRAATMFSGFAIGNLFMRRTNTLNMLLASALVLLFFNPNLLVHPGFQLSYAAVWAIVSFVPILQRWWPTKNFIALKIRDLLTVSLAAQLGTLPLTLYYFQTFPTYFLLGNLLVLPVIPIVMYLGLMALLSGLLGYPGSWLVKVLDFILMAINKLVGVVADWPLAQISFPQWPFLFYALMSLFIFSLLMFFKSHNFKSLAGMLVSAVLMSVVQLWQVYQIQNTAGFMVVEKNAEMAILGFDGYQTCWLLPPKDAIQQKTAADFVRIKGLNPPQKIAEGNANKLLDVGGKWVAIAGVPKTVVDYVIWPTQPSYKQCNSNALCLTPRSKKGQDCWQPHEEIRGTALFAWKKPKAD